MQIPIFDAVFKGLLFGLYMAISVGPTLFAVIKYSLESSYKAGIAFVIGVSVSDIMYVTLANYAASWLILLGNYKTVIGISGAIILIAAGLVGLVKKQKSIEFTGTGLKIQKGDLLKIFASGYLINTVNPGVIISWLSAVTATANTTSFYRFTLFGTCLFLILSIDFLKVLLAEKIRRSLTEKRIMLLQKLSSVILMILGLLLILSTCLNN